MPPTPCAAHPSRRRPGRRCVAQRGSSDRVRILDDTARTAQDAATALGVEVAQIVKSLVFTTAGDHGPEPLLVLTSGSHQVDVHKVADLLGIAGLGRADADFVREHTGFAIGGVAPVGTTSHRCGP